MNTKLKITLSSFLTMLLLVIFVVVLTNNESKGETSKYGKNSANSQCAQIYIKPADISFEFPPGTDRFFIDTKNATAAGFLKQAGAVFAAEFTGDPSGVEIHIDSVDTAQYSDYENVITDEDAVQALEQDIIDSVQYDVLEWRHENIVANDVITFIHLSYVYENSKFSEYNIVSDYVAVINQKLVEFRFYSYDKREFTLDADLADLDELFEDVLDSVSLGDNVKETNVSGFMAIFTKSFSFVAFLIILFYILSGNVKIADKYNVWHEDALSQTHSKEILGFFAVCIVLHHLVQQIGVGNAGSLSFLENAGVNFVGAYFFYSGYGLLCSFHNKKDYMKGFFKKRLPAILIPFYLMIIIFVLVRIATGELMGAKDIILSLTGINLINGHMWYIVEIFILYFLFWLIFAHCKNEGKSLILMTLVSLVMIVGSVFLGHGDHWFQGEWWYNTTLLFVGGMFFSRYENRIIPYIKKHYKKVLAVAIVVFVALYIGTQYILEHFGYWTEFSGKSIGQANLDKFITLGVQLPMVVSFVLLIVIVGQKLQCSNGILKFLGTISLELYLIHNLFIKMFSFASGHGIYFVTVLLLSIIAAYVLHKIDTFIICHIQHKSVPKHKSIKPALEKYIKAEKMKFNDFIRMCRVHPRRVVKRVVRELVCILLVLMALYPIIVLMVNATLGKTITTQTFIPGKYFLQNLEGINEEFKTAGGSVYKGIFNSCLIATSTALLGTYISSLAAYGFARYKFKGKSQLYKCVIVCMLMPSLAGFAGLYQLIAKFHMVNNFLPVILLGVANPAAVYFIHMYLQNMSLNEIAEAARIDGAREFRIYNTIIMPMIRPVLALQITFSFVNAWNNGFAQTSLLIEWDKKPLVSYVKLISGDKGAASDPACYALALASTIAPLIVYILCSKSIVSSITLGAIKE